MTTNSHLNNQTIVRKQNFFEIDYEDIKLSVDYEISTYKERTKINFYVNSSKKISSEKEEKLEKMYSEIFSEHQNQNISRDYNLWIKELTFKEKIKKTIFSFSTILQRKRGFSLFHSYKRRQISTFFDNNLIASTIIDIDADIHNFISTDVGSLQKFLLQIHSYNIRLSGCMIQKKFNQFIDGLIRSSYILAVISVISSHIIWFSNGFTSGKLPNFFDFGYMGDFLIFSTIIPVGAYFIRKLIMKFFLRSILRLLTNVIVRNE